MPHPGTNGRAILEFKPLTADVITKTEKQKTNTLLTNRLIATIRHFQEETKKYTELYVERVKLNNEKMDIIDLFRDALGRKPALSIKDYREWAAEIRKLRTTGTANYSNAAEYTRLRKTIDDQRAEIAMLQMEGRKYRTQAESDFNRVQSLNTEMNSKLAELQRNKPIADARIRELEQTISGYGSLGLQPWFDLSKAWLPCHEFIAKCLDYWKLKAKSYAPRPNDLCRCEHTANSHNTVNPSAHARNSIEPRTDCFSYGCWCKQFEIKVA